MKSLFALTALVLLLACLTVVGCSSGHSNAPVALYVSGFAHNATTMRDFPLVWSGLSYTQLSRLDPTCHGYATGIATLQGSVYLSGTSPRCFGTSEAMLIVGAPVVWKDGQRTDLPTPDNNHLQAVAEAVAVNANGDVVVVGAVSSSTGPGGLTVPAPAYWKNNALNILTISPACTEEVTDACYDGAIVTSAAFSGSDLYLAGYAGYANASASHSKYMVPVLWKNGVFSVLPVDLANNLAADEFYRVRVYGDDVYVFGVVTNLNDVSESYPAHWKNGQLTVLRDQVGVTYDAVVQNGSVYAAGYYYNHRGFANPAVWDNGAMTPLSMLDPALVGLATGIQYLGDNQYVSGYNFYQPDPSENTWYAKPAVWVNGERTNLNAPPLNGSTMAENAAATSGIPGMSLYKQWKANEAGDPQWKDFAPYLNTNRLVSNRQPMDDVLSHAVATGIAVE